jgi:hypothetical protein
MGLSVIILRHELDDSAQLTVFLQLFLCFSQFLLASTHTVS